MNFQSYKLPKNKRQKNKSEQPKRKVRTKLIAAICLSIIALVILVKAEAPKRIIRNTVVNTIAKDLEHDELGYTNFLIMGTGGEGHDGKDLTDTLMIASINPSSSSTILSSVPRDIYVSHPQIISQRINSVYANQKYQSSHQEAAEVLGDIIEDLTNIEIHYNIKIDFQALVEVVDELGGVTINNQEAIYDPEYPGPNYTFQTFSLPAGEQTIDGETALKYARSRKSSSDFERSRRQQQLIYAIKDAALSQNITSSPQKITSIYNSVSKHVETNLQLSEILTLAKLAQEFPEESLTTLPLTDDPNFIGGFLYNPPRSEYGDAYVLIPADSTNSQIHTYFELYRKYPFAMQANTEINLFNGTEINGFAGSVKQNLKRFGFTVNETANAQSNDYQQSQINLIGQNELLAQQVTESLNRLLEIPESQISYTPIQEEPTEANMDKVIINIILGQDLAEITDKLDVYSSLYSRIQQAINENRAAQNESNLLEENSEQDDQDQQDQPTNTINQSEEENSNKLEPDNTTN